MQRFFQISLLILICFINISWKINSIDSEISFENEISNNTLSLYQQLNNKNLKFEVFSYAYNGYLELKSDNKLNNSRYLSIIDMSLSSKLERLFIIDLVDNKIVHQSVVAHGKNSGLEFAKYFSNKINSHQSSLGFYKTAETYHGKHGLSLRLDGLEFSNSNARKRAIVIHSADYATKKFIVNNGRLGRSYGCPSLPLKDYNLIIDKIKAGSALFIYSSDKNYLNSSSLIASN